MLLIFQTGAFVVAKAANLKPTVCLPVLMQSAAVPASVSILKRNAAAASALVHGGSSSLHCRDGVDEFRSSIGVFVFASFPWGRVFKIFFSSPCTML